MFSLTMRSHRNLLTILFSVIELRFCFGVFFLFQRVRFYFNKFSVLSHLSLCDVLSFLSYLGEKIVLIIFMLMQKSWDLVSIHRCCEDLRQKPSKVPDGCRSWIPATAQRNSVRLTLSFNCLQNSWLPGL